MNDNYGLPLYVVRVSGGGFNTELVLRVLDDEQAVRVAKSIIKDRKDKNVELYEYEVHRVR